MNIKNILSPILSEARGYFLRKIDAGLFKLLHYDQKDNGNEIVIIAMEGFVFRFEIIPDFEIALQQTGDIGLDHTFYNEDYKKFRKHIKNKLNEYKQKEKELELAIH